MSLRDTIEGARREAEGNSVKMPKAEAAAVTGGDDEKKGFVRSSAAKARPAREAASSVRVATKPKSTDVLGRASETKEEKRERRRREREEQDIRNRAFDLILRNNAGYRKTEKIFWVIVGIGFAVAVISLAFSYAFGEGATDLSSPQGVLSVATLVIAYACIIGGIIYDLVKRRPYRKQAEAQLRGISDKKLLELFEQEHAEQLARQAKKSARKK